MLPAPRAGTKVTATGPYIFKYIKPFHPAAINLGTNHWDLIQPPLYSSKYLAFAY